MARHLVARAPFDLLAAPGRSTPAPGPGVAGDALRARGARVVAADREFDMASYGARPGRDGGRDRAAVPGGAFDVVVAAFVVNHLPDPAVGPGRAAPGDPAGRCGAGLDVLRSTARRPRARSTRLPRRTGSSPPTGTATSRSARTPFGDPAAVERALAAAGFARWTVTEEPVDVGLTEPADVVRYRLAVPHLHRVRDHAARRRADAFVAEAVEAVRRTGERFAPVVVEAVAVA